MAKKFVRGITDIKTISKQDFDTNNVNDLLSDGEHNYIHRKKKDNSDEYHNLTNNLKTITSDNTDLISVTNYNNSTNSATIHPKHDAQKEQSIESTRNTITIQHATNGTSGKTKVDTNPAKVLEHGNLKSGDGLSVVHQGNNSTIKLNSTKKPPLTDLDNTSEGIIYGRGFPQDQTPGGYNQRSATYLTFKFDDDKKVQIYIRESGLTDGLIIAEYRFIKGNDVTPWKSMAVDSDSLTNSLNNKQNTLTNSTSIAVIGKTLRQLYALKQTYTVSGGVLKTHVKSVSKNTDLNTPEEEFNFIVKLNKGVSSVNFTLNSHDTTKFSNIMSAYGDNNTVCISGCVFTLSGSTLTVTTANNTQQNYVITFSDII